MTPASFLQCGGHRLDLTRPRVMGVVNATPDSFSDGGRYLDPAQAIAHARQLVADGADIVDVGGESTRPGADEVSAAAECARVLPVVRALALDGAIVSVDTSKPEVIRAAVDAGASMINDVRALRVAGALDAAAASGAALCLMHMKGDPRTMQQAPQYADVVADVREFLAERIDAARAAGIPGERIAVDPGFGFGKTLEHNVAVMRGLPALAALGYPVVVGYSRKSSLGAITGRGPHDRLAASLTAALVAIARGARIVRVHDVRETVDALAVWTLMQAQ